MQTKHSLIGGLALALVLPAVAAAPVAPDTPLIVDGPVTVDAADFEGNILRIPEARRGEFRMSYDRVAAVVDNIFIARALAAKARQAGLDQDPAVQRRLTQLQDAFLADLYVQRMERDAPKVDLEPRARELYKADQTKFVTGAQAYIQQILITFNGRTREMALERARKAYEEAKAGKEDFLAVASRYSEDPDMKRNGGDLGYNSMESYAPGVAKAVATGRVKGEILEPIESERGFHVVRFVDLQKAEPLKFEAVRKKLVDAENEKLAKKRLEDLLESLRKAPTVVVHPENVEKLVIPVDMAKLQQAAEAAAKR